MTTFTFTNNNNFSVVLYSVLPGSTQETRQGEISPRTELSLTGDFPTDTDWRIRDSTDGSLIDTYRATSNNSQSHAIQDYRQIQVALDLENRTPAPVYVYTVDPVSKIEKLPWQLNRALNPGERIRLNLRPLFPNTEIRFKQAGGTMFDAPTLIQTYLTTPESYQHYIIYPPVSSIPANTDTPVLYTPVHTEEINITGPLTNTGPLNPQPKPKADTPIVLGAAKDSVLNSRSFNLDVAMIESSIRQRANLSDKNTIRAALYAGLMAIARAKDRTPKEQAVMDWLALQVKKSRIEAARLALAEYDRWNIDPWAYHPPSGYGFPAYVLDDPRSPVWLAKTPHPPVLANKSLLRFLAEIISSNGWSPLNNPILTKGMKKQANLEGVIGFPTFGTVLAYQKLYNSPEGVTSLASTTSSLTKKSFNLAPLETVAVEVSSQIGSLRLLALPQVAPYSYKVLEETQIELATRAAGTAPGNVLLEKMSVQELQEAIKDVIAGEALTRFFCTFVLTVALQAIIHEAFALDTKRKLRNKLAETLSKQQSAPLPDLQNLLYFDIRDMNVVHAPDYQPADEAELERLMGGHEVYRAFLLATIE